MLKPKFGKDYIRKELARQRQGILANLVQVMARVGEEFVTDARSSLNIDTSAFPKQREIKQRDIDRGRTVAPAKGDYLDDSGNLRSSIGYAVLVDSKVVVANLPENNEGRSYFSSIIASLPYAKGLALVGIAGRDYASYLEAMGYNVISSQANVAVVNLFKDLKRFEASANRKLSNFESRIIKGL